MEYKSIIPKSEIYFDNQLVEANEDVDIHYILEVDADGIRANPAHPNFIEVEILDEMAHEDMDISGTELNLDRYRVEVVSDSDVDFREDFEFVKMFIKTGSKEIFLQLENV